ncbi:kinase-like protein [Polychaeton citri CBS 116435]|uniref:1-phosphatidylinositol 4-kinase n=1 Tax=Polychaeton citri CBS 116435 TaxID=1314669 RepID=A0A9P4UMK1_9PEZI|nr:kinase-like protein [Polychaeton citri CBS 116435]
MSWNLLARFIESEHFNRDPSLTVAYLARYSDHVGIQYVLCHKLRQFSYEEIEFFLPQLCHLIISVDNESMALEEFIIDLCEESVNAALLTFWLFQTYLHDLAAQPALNSFQTCRRLYNKVQSIVFGGQESSRRERIKENVLPTTVLSSLVLASIASPLLPQIAGPLAIAQARRPRPIEDILSDALPAHKPQRSHTVSAGPGVTRRGRPGPSDSKEGVVRRTRRPQGLQSNGEPTPRPGSNLPHANERKRPSHKHRQQLAATRGSEGFVSSSSLPDHRNTHIETDAPPLSAGLPVKPGDLPRRHSHTPRPLTPSTLSRIQKIRLLRQHYFKSEMAFLSALEGISARLVAVPKPARLSALRAELALIAQDLPAEVDVPFICPASLVDGQPGRSKHHRIVRLNPGEATSLNSAQKVPYLLMLEVLKDDFDFDPDSEQNQRLLINLLSEKGKSRRRLFDTSEAAQDMQPQQEPKQADSVFEPVLGDLASPALLQDVDADAPKRTGSPSIRNQTGSKEPPRLSSGVSTLSTTSIPTPRNSDGPISRSSSPGFRSFGKVQQDQADISALATHMRTAAQMLAQLELSTSKRPKAEVAAIKAKIIASMQSLEEQSFLTDEQTQGPSFESIMAKAGATGSHAHPSDFEDDEMDAPTDPNLSTAKGADRMENDFKTGGVQRHGDRDDPSAATFGEAWEQKKERIRRSSPYGWAHNWDLVSVIVKTGDDLRQEAFACQMIAICSKIWVEHNVDVWVKNMRILVTGESSGLIETITNGVSLHSLKRSLTLALSAANAAAPGANSKKQRIATLTDHFIKTFGPVDSPSFARATRNFARSLAAYSAISYVLQLKDRHNGNILIDAKGHVIHIDFGFMLSNSPGNVGFEAAPFKLTLEYIDLLGGVEGEAFLMFKERLKDALQALRREAERILTMVELIGKGSKMAAFSAGGLVSVMASLRGRFVLEKTKEEARDWVEDLVAKSAGSYYTRLYDTFQYRTQGIY